MLAVVKMPHTSFTVSGDIPENILSILKTYYKKHLILEDEKNEYVEASTMDWYKEAEKDKPLLRLCVFIEHLINLLKYN